MGGNDRRHRDDHGTAHAEGDAAGAHAEALPAFAYDFTIGGSDPAQLARTLAALPASQLLHATVYNDQVAHMPNPAAAVDQAPVARA